MTPNVASFIKKLDQERLSIGKEFGVDLMPVMIGLFTLIQLHKAMIFVSVCATIQRIMIYWDQVLSLRDN